MNDFVLACEILIFVSYSILSTIVFEIFIKNIKEFKNALVISVVVLTSMFLMLCAFTHLDHVWGDNAHNPLTIACGFVSTIAAAATIYLRPEINETLTRRFRALKVVKDDMIVDLIKGYNLNVSVEGGVAVRGSINGIPISNPENISVTGVETSSVVDVLRLKFRIIHKIHDHVGSEEQNIQTYTLFGIDVTYEHSVRELNQKNNDQRMALCFSTAHDIRTPLSSITFLSDQITKFRGVLENSQEFLGELSIHLELLNLVATQMMDVGKLLGGYSLTPTYSEINIRDMFSKLEKTTKYIHEDKINTVFEVDSSVPLLIISDREWILQILLNFITNSFKYTYSGYVKTYCNIKTDENESLLTIRTVDSGIGIPEKDIGRVFDLFSNIQKQAHGSKGVGLFTVRSKVDAMGGSCKVYKNDDERCRGTIVEATFPVHFVLIDKEDEIVSEPTQKSFLVVDDTNSIIRVMQRYLKGYHVDVAYNGEDALDIMFNKEYDMIFMDLTMPIMGGIEAVTIFRGKEPSLGRTKKQRIAMMSATEIDRHDLFTDKLPKPLRSLSLEKIIKSL